MTSSINISGIELYGYLGLQKYATEAEVKKAYKKLALKLHPDKNPGKKDAAENFQKLQKVCETLTNITKKGEYDQKLRAMERNEKRLREMDAKTQHFKKKSEQKNKEYLEKKEQEERQRREKESLIQWMREEGRRKLREEELEREKQAKRFCSVPSGSDGYSIKVSWKTNKKGIEPAYSEEEIKEIFSKFGEILHVVKSKKKQGLYLINFATKESAVLSTTETGKQSHPLLTKLSFELGETSTAENVHGRTDPKEISFDDLLRKYGINPDLSTDFNKASEKSDCKPGEIDEETGLPIKYVYPHGTDTIFACAATFALPPEIRLKGNEEVVYGGFVVRLWPSERVKYNAPND